MTLDTLNDEVEMLLKDERHVLQHTDYYKLIQTIQGVKDTICYKDYQILL